MEGIFTQSFSLNLLILRFIGLYPPENNGYWHKIRAYVTFSITLLPTSVFASIQYVFKESTQRVDYNDFASTAIIFITFKILAFLINSDKIEKWIKYCNEAFIIKQKVNQQKIIEECIAISKRNSTIFVLAYSLTTSTWFGFLYFQDHRHHFPLNVWLPFETTESPIVHYCVYFTQLLGIVYAGAAIAAIDPLLTGLMYHAAGQINFLKYNLKNVDRHVDEQVTAVYNKTSKSKIIHVKITESILHYEKIINFVNCFEKNFSWVIFIQFLESIVSIGFCCLQVTKIEGVNANLYVYISFLCTLLFQVYFYCYYGTILYEESNTLTSAIYMSRWYEYNMKSQKMLMFLMTCSTRPMIVSAGKILDVSLGTFIMIMKTSYSLIAVLKDY